MVDATNPAGRMVTLQKVGARGCGPHRAMERERARSSHFWVPTYHLSELSRSIAIDTAQLRERIAQVGGTLTRRDDLDDWTSKR